MNKMIAFFKKNYLYLFLIIPFFFICLSNIRPDNDVWFLLCNGKYVFEHGIPKIDPFSIHEGLDYIMQQWLSSALVWKLYSWFGKRGILLFVMVVSVLLLTTYYKLCYVLSNNKKLSILVSVIIFIPMKYFIVSRPQIITYLVIVLELLLLELYIKKKDIRYLIPLPIMSILEINFHSTMWAFMFIVMIPYLLNCINIKNITVDKISWKPLVVVIILMIICGLINPYGYKNLLIIFNSYGSTSINKYINEMKAISFEQYLGKTLTVFLLGYVLLVNVVKHEKLDIRHMCLLSGFTLLAFMHNKGLAYFLLSIGVVMSYQFRNIDIDKIEKKYLGKNINYFRNIVMSISIFIVVAFGYTLFLNIRYYQWSTYTSHSSIAKFIIDNYDVSKVRLYTKFDEGSYFEYRGIKCYIDGRAEVFLKKFNHKKDIMDEYYELTSNRTYDYDSFLKEYHFTHILVDTDTSFHDYLITRDDYEVVYNDWFDDDETFAIRKLFAYVGD